MFFNEVRIFLGAVILLQQVLGFFFSNCVYGDNTCPNDKITFWLYTKETQDNPVQLNILELRADDFRSTTTRRLEVIVHGFTGHKDFSPNPEVRPPLLENLDVFVISIDYGPLAREPCYVHAVANAPIVGRCLAQFVDALIDEGFFTPDDIHIIGFSLGSQIAGLTANFVKHKLKWITGLDPAKPLFETSNDMNRLDSNDAEFVDVIHTDILERGIFLPSGHIDFYPNFGQYQPGCALPNVTNVGSCNHKRAPEFYGESITSTVGFWGYHCLNWMYYLIGICYNGGNAEQQIMGFYVSKNATGSYFLKTNESPPFAQGPYNMTRAGSAKSALEIFQKCSLNSV